MARVDSVDRFLNFLHTLPDSVIYLTLGFCAFVENVFPPIPGDTITAFGAFLVGTKRLNFLGVYLSTTVGSLSGFMFLFWVGGVVGRRFLIEKDYRFFKAKDIVRAEVWFQRFGYLLIVLNRFFPGIRSVISLAGGISGLNSLKTAVLALISCGVWNLIWIGFGYTLGTNWETVKGKMAHIMVRYNFLVLALLVAGVLFFLAKKIIKRS
jgi:membrane protein DedA with SNARE-associated domain